MQLSVVAPCYNEADGLQEFYERTLQSILGTGIEDYEMVLVDDGSEDETWNEIKRLGELNRNVKGLRLSRNFGHQAALMAGLDLAAGENILIIDADLQDPPELLGAMLEERKKGLDVVYGKRLARHGEGVFKKLSAFLFYRILALSTEVPVPSDTGDFRLMHRRVLEAYRKLPESQRFTRGLIAWLGFRQGALLYERNPRFTGQTHYPLKKMVALSMDAITALSLKPIRLVIWSGVLLLLCSLIMLWQKPGMPQLIFFACGIQLLALGVIGEYVGRTFIEAKRRPVYLIRESTFEAVSTGSHLNLPKAEDFQPRRLQ